jgi:3-hydroxybutyryl-CoA dehydrogenase
MANDLEKSISTIGVIGAGQMGSGIAQLAATAGFSVLLHDSDAAALGRAGGLISASLRRLASKGHISQVSLPRCISLIRQITLHLSCRE